MAPPGLYGANLVQWMAQRKAEFAMYGVDGKNAQRARLKRGMAA